MRVQTIDGREYFMEATNSDSRLKQHHEAQKKAEAKQAKVNERLRKEKTRREAAIPTPSERMEAAVEGLRKTGEKASRRSEPRGDEVLKIVAEAVSELHEYSELTRQLQERQADPLADAADKAAKELRKAVPSGFDNQDEARRWALRFLPLTGARQKATRAADQRGELSRQRNKAAFSFWAAIQKGAVKSGLAADDRVLDYLTDLGAL